MPWRGALLGAFIWRLLELVAIRGMTKGGVSQSQVLF